jgi:RNA polymerase sigma-70 factor (ECF subfamily)
VADDAPSSERPRDADLVGRLRAGDEAAFRELVRGMHRALSRVALAFVADAASAEEVVQETWVAVVAQIDRFEQRSSVRTWIGSILVNRAKTRAVRDKRSVPFSSLSSEDREPVEPERFNAAGFWSAPPRKWGLPGEGRDSGPESLALRKEAREAIERELARLPESQRTVVVLRDLEEWSSEEVCNVLGLSETNQRVLLHRGRLRLRAALERYHSGDGA